MVANLQQNGALRSWGLLKGRGDGVTAWNSARGCLSAPEASDDGCSDNVTQATYNYRACLRLNKTPNAVIQSHWPRHAVKYRFVKNSFKVLINAPLHLHF